MTGAFQDWFGKLNPRWTAGLVLGILLLCVYWPVLTFDYLYHDDWLHFAGRQASCAGSPMFEWSRVTGRLAGQYVLCGLFDVFGSPAEAWRARLLVLLGIFAFAFLQWRYFQAVGIGWMTAVCLAFGTSVLPGMLVFSYWITAGSIVLALVASVSAALLTEAAVDRSRGVAARVLLVTSACVLQGGALLIYQTLAMYFWTLTAVMLAMRLSSGLKAGLRPLALYAVAGIIPMACYFIWFRYLSGLAAALKVMDASRGTMFVDMPDKAKWFLDAALPRASSLWFFDRSREFGLTVFAIFVISMIWISARMWWIARQRRDRNGSVLYAAYPLLIAGLASLAYSPMMVTVFSVEVFRSMIPLSGLILLTGVIHLGILLRAESWSRPLQVCVAVGFVFGLTCLAVASLISRMVLPAVAECSFVRGSLLDASHEGSATKGVHVIVPRRTARFTTDEMDNLTIQFTQDASPMIQSIGEELGLRVGPASSSLQGEPFEHHDALILDFAELSRSGLWRSVRAGDPPQEVRNEIVGGPRSEPNPNSPSLLRSDHGYNLVVYHGHVYGISQSLGPLSLVDWISGRVDKLPGVIIENTAEAVLARIPNAGKTASGPAAATAPVTNKPPELLRSHRGYNLVAYRGRLYGVPVSLGALYEVDWDTGRVDKLPGVIIEDTLDKLMARLPK